MTDMSVNIYLALSNIKNNPFRYMALYLKGFLFAIMMVKYGIINCIKSISICSYKGNTYE